MDATTSGTETIQYCNIPEQPIAAALVTSPRHTFQRQVRHCFGDSVPGEFPLAAKPSIVLHVLSASNLDPQDLAKLEASELNHQCSLAELAALDMCQMRAIFKPMTPEQKDDLKQRCGGSWKLVLRYLLAGEACCRREKSQAIAGPGHSIAVTSKGAVYSFGSNSSGQLGHGLTPEGSTADEYRPRLIRSLQGIRIIQATVGAGRTMLISDAGKVYAFGKHSFGEAEFGAQGGKTVNTPQVVESLKDIFVVQAAIGNFFTAVLSREGRVYTLSWGCDGRLGHQTDPNDVQPYPLLGALENIPVVQIAAGYCYLLALACQPGGMSVYSVGCGLGGKLGHGTRTDEKYPRLIEKFQALNLQPMVVAAGAWHAAVVGKDGRVCTWGWGRYGCLGHGCEDCESVPKVVESLSDVKAIHVATGDYTTFVVSDIGDGNRHVNVLKPELVTSLKEVKERVVQISLTNSIFWNAHTFALTESGKLYAFGAGDKGQLGAKLEVNTIERGNPEPVEIDLSN
ncbi:Ultraviolet-B receptor UVR8 [Bienertia sinuspersici]